MHPARPHRLRKGAPVRYVSVTAPTEYGRQREHFNLSQLDLAVNFGENGDKKSGAPNSLYDVIRSVM